MTFSNSQSPFPPEPSPASESVESSSAIPQFPVPPPPPQETNAPEDIRTPWGFGELLIFFGFAIGSLFVMEIILAFALFARYHLTANQLVDMLKTNAPVAISFQTAWSVVILLFLFILIRVYHGAPFWDSLRWRRLQWPGIRTALPYLICIFGGIALAVIVSAGSQFAGETKKLPIEDLLTTRTNMLWFAAFGIAFAPFFEEILFRGFLYPVFARKWGIPSGIVITGVLFGLMHAAQLWGGFLQIALLIFVGIVLTFARARTGTVLASYLIHVSYNSFLFAGLFISTHALKNIPPIH